MRHMDQVLHKNFYEFIKDRERRKRKKKQSVGKQKRSNTKNSSLPRVASVDPKTGEPDEAACYQTMNHYVRDMRFLRKNQHLLAFEQSHFQLRENGQIPRDGQKAPFIPKRQKELRKDFSTFISDFDKKRKLKLTLNVHEPERDDKAGEAAGPLGYQRKMLLQKFQALCREEFKPKKQSPRKGPSNSAIILSKLGKSVHNMILQKMTEEQSDPNVSDIDTE